MAKGDNRRAAIRNIAETRRVSRAVAAHIYACASIKKKAEWSERLRRKNSTTEILLAPVLAPKPRMFTKADTYDKGES